MHKHSTPKIKQTEPQQKYHLGTISNVKLLGVLNRFYMALTSPASQQWFTIGPRGESLTSQ